MKYFSAGLQLLLSSVFLVASCQEQNKSPNVATQTTDGIKTIDTVETVKEEYTASVEDTTRDANWPDFELALPVGWKEDKDNLMYSNNTINLSVYDSHKTIEQIDAAREYNRKNQSDAGGEGFYNDLIIEKYKNLDSFKKATYLKGNSLQQVLTQNGTALEKIDSIAFAGNFAYIADMGWTYGDLNSIITEHKGAVYLITFGNLMNEKELNKIKKYVIKNFQFKK